MQNYAIVGLTSNQRQCDNNHYQILLELIYFGGILKNGFKF